jgi:hypothetical protein
MRKFYAFLLAAVVAVFAGISSKVLAQGTFTCKDYIVRAVAYEWNELREEDGARRITELNPQPFFFYIPQRVASEVAVPFNFVFGNIPDARFVKVGEYGQVYVSNRVSGTATPPTPSSVTTWWYWYNIGYAFYYPATSSSDQYYPNYAMYPWSGGYMTNIPSTQTSSPYGMTTYLYQTLGTAPNRRFVVQTKNMVSYAEWYQAYYNGQWGRGSCASWQVQIFESGSVPSKIRYFFKNEGQGNADRWYLDYAGAFGATYVYYYYSVLMGIKTWGYYGTAYGYGTAYDQGQIIVDPVTSNAAPVNSVLTDGTDYNRTVLVASPYSFNDASVLSRYDCQNKPVPTARGIEFAIYYNINLAWTNPNLNPAHKQIRSINIPITPSATITNEGRTIPSTATISCVITQVGVGVVYSSATSIFSPDARLGQPFGGIGTVTSMSATFTPTSYGIYNMTFTISGVPGENFTGDNVINSSFTVSPNNNIRAVRFTGPKDSSRIPLNVGIPVSCEFENIGAFNQAICPVSVYIKNPLGAVVYRDTVILTNFLSGQTREVTFRDFSAVTIGRYEYYGVALLSGDQLQLDDTTMANIFARYEADVAAISVFDPEEDGEKPEGKAFRPVGIFQSVGVRDLFDVPVRVQIRRCTDNQLVYQADSLPGIPELNNDEGQKKFSFPARQGIYDIRNIPAGCYKMCVIARLPDDGDRLNDTACTFFSFIPKLKGDIEVGVGRRFRTISAAVDSMRYRGIGGHLNLILTDASYSENGATSVSTPTGAINFAGIEGTGPDAVVTWKPRTNVFPVITFTGIKPNCFEMGFGSPAYMVFNGYNGSGPDVPGYRAEPSKRGITIVNQSSGIGSTFLFDFGRSNITLKNLKIWHNGNRNNTNSRAIQIRNTYDLQSFNAGVNDTQAHRFITIDNNEIGNATFGIWDFGTIPLFNIGKAVFEDRRNNNNVISRNTIGTQAYPIGNFGIYFSNEDGLRIERNDISWITGGTSTANMAGIAQLVGNSVNVQINGNRINNIGGTTTSYGIALMQQSTIYTVGSGPTARSSTLPVVTRNRIMNNFLYDIRNSSAVSTNIMPIAMWTGTNSYWTENDSVFNNSIAVNRGLRMVWLRQCARPFIWNNIIQNTNSLATSTAVVYDLNVPRPWAQNISMDNNLFDLRNSGQFAVINEFDRATGLPIFTLPVVSLNDWRTLTGRDINSVTGDPRFASDSLHLPAATSYIFSPASNAGAWLGTASQNMDVDGDPRLVGNDRIDIGADEFEGFEYFNDLGVQVITLPSGLTNGTGSIVVTSDNPLNVQAIVKNLGGIIAQNKKIYARLDTSRTNGLNWVPIWNAAPQTRDFNVGESKTIDFGGANVVPQPGTIYRVTVWVDNDQYNPNNQLQKTFSLVLKTQAVLVSFTSKNASGLNDTKGLANRDSLTRALDRLGVKYDVLDRSTFGANPIDYSPWWTVIWATGDPTQTYNNVTAPGVPLGVGAPSLKETEEIANFLRAGRNYAKKSFVIAGQNVAQYKDPSSPFAALSNTITDREFMNEWMHTNYRAAHPGLNFPAVPTMHKGRLIGEGVYFRFADTIVAASPDVITVFPVTPTVGTDVSRIAYRYETHPATPFDNGAGTAWTSSNFNVVFYAFDWADAIPEAGKSEIGINTSGTTRFVRGALDFIQSFKGTVLPVEFVNVKGIATADGNEISWKVAAQKNVDRYEVETLNGDNWTFVGEVKANTASNYSFTHNTTDAFEVRNFTYRVVSVDLDGARSASPTVTFGRTADGLALSLEQNYPNPFSGTTNITYILPENGYVALRVMDMTGKVVASLVNADKTAGKHIVPFTTNLASGSYVYEISFTNTLGETRSLTKVMTLKK